MYIQTQLNLLCRIDGNFVIKVADFGLSVDVYEKNYYRQDGNSSVKLPIKWMALESINDLVFSEKSDVVSRSLVYMLQEVPGFSCKTQHKSLTVYTCTMMLQYCNYCLVITYFYWICCPG